MKIVKLVSVIAATVAVTCILLFTFMQDPFKERAPVKIFWYDTPSDFPMYVYAAAAFGLGLLIGFLAAAYYYIKGQAGIHNKKKEIRRLEEVVKERDGELDRLRADTARALEKITGKQKAITEKDVLF